MNFRRLLTILVAAALVLPIVTVLLVGTARLLAAMQDQAGAQVLDRCSLASGLLWAVALIALIIVQTLHTLGPPPGPPLDEPLE